jgi:hypothetical protein
MIYFIACPETQAVKIGYATDPIRRFSKIQSDTPGELSILGVEDGGKDRESQLHRQFAADRRRGEWFNLSTDIRAHIATLPEFLVPKKRKPLGGSLGQWLIENNLTLEAFATLAKTNKNQISYYCSGRSIPRRDLMRRIYVLTHGQVQPNDFYDLPPIAVDLKQAA